MDLTNAQNTISNTEDDNVEKFFMKVPYPDDNVENLFEVVPYCEEDLSTTITYDYLSDSDWNTDSDIDKNQTDMGSSTNMNEKDNKDDVNRIKKTPMKQKKQSCDSFTNITVFRQSTETASPQTVQINCGDVIKSPDKLENNFNSFSSLTFPKRLSYSPQKFTKVYSRSTSLRTSFPPKANENRKHCSNSFNYTGVNRPLEIQDFRYKQFSKIDQQESVPLYKDHQLVGDSQLLRFAEQMLDMKKDVMYSSLENGKSRRIGYCISGQNINDLNKRLMEAEYKIHEKVIVLIGTNDILQRTNIQEMYESFEKILNILKKSANKIVLLTVPPVPRIHSKPVLKTLREFNKFIVEKADGETIFAIDLSSHYIGYDNTVMNTYYESSFFDGRPDMIHLNKKGFKYLRNILNINYFDEFN